MSRSGVLLPTCDMHINSTSGTVIDSGTSFFVTDWAFHVYFSALSGPLLSSFLSSLPAFSDPLFLLSVV